MDVDRPSATTFSYSVTATSVAGTTSQRSELSTAATSSFALLAPKLSPYIVFETGTGKIWSQMFASPGIMARAQLPSGFDVIALPRIDPTLLGIRVIGPRQYSIYQYSTGAAVGAPIPGVDLSAAVPFYASYVRLDMGTGGIVGWGSGPAEDLLLNIPDGGGGYLSGEVL